MEAKSESSDSTSGNSKNVSYVAITAKARGMKVIGLTGMGGGKLCCLADEVIAVDETETYKVQELHLPVYHCLCLMLEDYFLIFKEMDRKFIRVSIWHMISAIFMNP